MVIVIQLENVYLEMQSLQVTQTLVDVRSGISVLEFVAASLFVETVSPIVVDGVSLHLEVLATAYLETEEDH